MVRKAEKNELSQLMELYCAAQRFMAETGNPNQWKNVHPPRAMIEEDIELGRLYVVEREGEVAGVFMFEIGEDPTYLKINAGSWMEDSPYGVIHRIAARVGARGVVREATEFALKEIGHIRIDTHKDNKIMQHVLEKIGFQRRGVIYVYDGTPREAYEYVAK